MDEWTKRCHVDQWEAWSSWVLGSGQPQLWDFVDEDLNEARKWLLNRFWPGRYPQLECAFSNFRLILIDFLSTFHEHAELRDDTWFTEKFYKKVWHDDINVYNSLVDEYDSHVDLVTDLCFELTRAANYVLESYRNHVSSSFREEQGLLTVQRGPDFELRWATYVPRYTAENLKAEIPYRGTKVFLESLRSRDCFFSTPSLTADSE